MKKILVVLVALITVASAHAKQQATRIYGIINNADDKPVDGATVTLLQLPAKKVMKINITNAKGEFEFENVKEGSYQVTVSAVGYDAAASETLTVAATQEALSVTIKPLAPAQKNLGNVVVEGKKNMVENKIDRMVVNVDAMISNAGGSALDVLEKSPGIAVDRDGNISLKGKQGVIILIDGKQTYMGSADLANYLRNMASNQLDQVEIMTQPPAKYDASGNSGLINIKTKKNKQNGFNGNLSLAYVQANYPKSPNSISINWRKNKINLFANYGFSYFEGFSELTLNRNFKNTTGNINSVFDQTSFQQFISRNHNLKTGLDFSASKNTTFGVVLTGNYNARDNFSESRSDIMNGNNQLDSFNLSGSRDHSQWKNFGTNFNFRHLLNNKGREITADADYVWYNSVNNQRSNNYMYFPNNTPTQNPFLLNGNLPSDIKIYSLKADYTHPIKEGESFEAGVKSSLVKTDNNAIYTLFNVISGKWESDVARSNHFLYDENINAIYGSYKKQFKKWGVQAGLRVENTNGKGNQKTNNSTFKRNYTQVFPTVYVSHTLNDKNSLTLSYGRRIDRPNYQDMNPFQYFLDQFTFRQGNPYLLPQFSHNIELSHTFMGKLVTTLNYTNTTDIINDVLKQNDTTKVTFQTKENIAKRTNLGLSVSYNNNITKWYMISVYFNAFNNHFTGVVNNVPLDVSIASYMFNLNNQFRFNKGWGAEMSGFYRSKTQEAGVIVANPMGVISFGASKQILKTKGSLKLALNDPFWIQKFSGYTKYGNIDVKIKSKWDNRRIALTFTYRFGKQTQQQAPRRRAGSAQDEQNRVGGGQSNQ
ncbi:MAG: outer membrane beta-barrel family protein [Bacteroidota bacterium]